MICGDIITTLRFLKISLASRASATLIRHPLSRPQGVEIEDCVYCAVGAIIVLASSRFNCISSFNNIP